MNNGASDMSTMVFWIPVFYFFVPKLTHPFLSNKCELCIYDYHGWKAQSKYPRDPRFGITKSSRMFLFTE